MKRDPRLQGLSREHHHALVLARRASAGSIDLDDARRRFEADLVPHFEIEERTLLPELRAVGETDLALRTEREHQAIRRVLDEGDLTAFGDLLTAHVRFEERELFPICERFLLHAS